MFRLGLRIPLHTRSSKEIATPKVQTQCLLAKTNDE